MQVIDVTLFICIYISTKSSVYILKKKQPYIINTVTLVTKFYRIDPDHTDWVFHISVKCPEV